MIKLTKTTSINPTLIPASLLIIVATFILSSCATLKKSDCLEGNWSGIGLNDGAAGLKSDSQFRAHTQACSKHKIAPNRAAYNAGYNQGLVKFCTKQSGYKRGVSKSEYYGVCPQVSQGNFLTGYLAGLETATAELTEDIAELRYKRHRAIRKHRHAQHHDETNTKTIEKWAERVDSLESSIDSRRGTRKKLRRWHDFWALKLK